MSRPYVKVFRYRLRPEAVGRATEIWLRAQKAYERHIPVGVLHVRSLDHPDTWLELDTYPDEASYRDAAARLDADPEIQALRHEFAPCLAEPGVEEESFEEVVRAP